MQKQISFKGCRVAALESRRAADMQRMIEKYGGVADVSPSMREVPIEPNRSAIDFAYRLITGQVSVVVLTTGVGFRYLLRAIEPHLDQQRFLDALSDVTTICRGPKPVAAMREHGVTPSFRVPEPNTWREVLQTIDAEVSISNQVVALQEYGVSNKSLIAGLEARGATVERIQVYGWDLPLDPSALKRNIRAIAAGERDILLVTSAHQIVNMLRLAEDLQLVEGLREGLRGTVIASIGPTTSQMLEESEIHIDLEPTHPKMGHLVVQAAEIGVPLIESKRRWQQMIPRSQPTKHPSDQSLFIRSCRGEKTERTPVWLMRQAGRYMQEYREVRAKHSFLELCHNPQLCSEVMCTAVDRLGVDAAIIFSDLLPILVPLGFDLEFAAGDGPVIHNPIRDRDGVNKVKELRDPQELDFVYETVRQTRQDLPEAIPVIGFAGSPFTLASYAIEGGGSRTYLNTKKLMRANDGAWESLMEKLSFAITAYLNLQIESGAQCVQLFDSWAGCLSSNDYVRYVLPWMKQIISGITPGVPVINFATGNPELQPLLRMDRRTVVGVDWRIPLDVAWKRIGHDCAVQGNLDPAILLADPEIIREEVAELLSSVKGLDGHIFNLGHGIHKETPVDHVIALVESVKELSVR